MAGRRGNKLLGGAESRHRIIEELISKEEEEFSRGVRGREAEETAHTYKDRR